MFPASRRHRRYEFKRVEALRNLAAMENRCEEKVSGERRRIQQSVESGMCAGQLASKIKMCKAYERLQASTGKARFRMTKDELKNEMREVDAMQYDRLKEEEYRLVKDSKRMEPKKVYRRVANVARRRDRRKACVESIQQLFDEDSDDEDGDDDEDDEESVKLAKTLIDEDICHRMTQVPVAVGCKIRTTDGT
ncbi:protein FAM50A-like [Anneissia japonica]|uniref:protein FAM50A-like n=1 Tax=Anneissia japonica TaxID=1529436 RepID=UPI0014258398|nr:protein FAM50A-like [Anneissia japonica]